MRIPGREVTLEFAPSTASDKKMVGAAGPGSATVHETAQNAISAGKAAQGKISQYGAVQSHQA